ncbi:hypothetical protein GCM10023190_06200 [Enteractinococcus fodinae]|uniref:O-methyltransferase YrrM n=1 Tax=Enteractinococcus fodinae TaxID=684663 RepID=A0ABU2B0G7_9MICC|nr:class I SAM-dependent methyltransferase [Enteractinococcus fodinae]MDR7346901.1 putative O-methyltransferase YrrM [Enteractinococcus fodinae]
MARVTKLGETLGTLRNIAIAMLSAITILGALGILAAINGWWVLVAALLFGGLIASVLSLLLIARYVTHHARTGEQRTKTVVQKLSARVKQGMRRQDEARARLDDNFAELSQSLSELQKTLTNTQDLSRKGLQTLDDEVSELDKGVQRLAKTNRQQLTHAIRDSTRQTESLVHIYQRYPEVKLPMPSTGGFAIDSQALAHLLAVVEERRPRRILELGSGTSTVWLGYLCQSIGGKLVSLDHLEHYLGLTRGAVDRHNLNDVIDTRLAPLEPTECDGKNFDWYSLAAMDDLSDIDMLIVDGPPAATGPQARYPSLPKLVHHLAPQATVILDDAHRDDEAGIVDAWLEAYPEFQHIEKGTSRLAVLERSGQ